MSRRGAHGLGPLRCPIRAGVLGAVTYQAAPGGGSLLFARLNWPGYTATVDGAAATVRESGAGLAVVDVPSGQHVVRLTFEEPGLRLGLWILLAATALAAVQAIWAGLAGEPLRRRPAREAGEPAGTRTGSGHATGFNRRRRGWFPAGTPR